MKARLISIGDSYQLLLCTGTIKKLSAQEAMRFIETYDSDLHYAGRGSWNYDALSMDEYGGTTIARVNDDGTLQIESPTHFRVLLNTQEIKYLGTAEYAERIGRARTIVNRMCKMGRIPGVKQVGNRWLIPENAPYPGDSSSN